MDMLKENKPVVKEIKKPKKRVIKYNLKSQTKLLPCLIELNGLLKSQRKLINISLIIIFIYFE